MRPTAIRGLGALDIVDAAIHVLVGGEGDVIAALAVLILLHLHFLRIKNSLRRRLPTSIFQSVHALPCLFKILG